MNDVIKSVPDSYFKSIALIDFIKKIRKSSLKTADQAFFAMALNTARTIQNSYHKYGVLKIINKHISELLGIDKALPLYEKAFHIAEEITDPFYKIESLKDVSFHILKLKKKETVFDFSNLPGLRPEN